MKSRKIDLSKINALIELESWGFTPSGNDEVKLKCPVHNDENPSVSLNIAKNLWKCYACGASGDVISLLAFIYKCDRGVMLDKLSSRYDLDDVKTIKLSTVEMYHTKIWEVDRHQLYERGVTDDLIRQHRLGFHEGRFTIPIFDEKHRCINVRKYLPGAPGHLKMRGTAGYSTIDLYPAAQTKYDDIWICGGEIKAIVAAKILNEHGVGAVTATAGEGNWDSRFNKSFKDKRIFICMDIDAAGRAAARKLAVQLYFVSTLCVVNLPLDPFRYPTGDINNWVMEGAKWEDFQLLMNSASPYILENSELEVESVEVRLIEATHSENVGKRINSNSMVMAMDTTPFLVPRNIGVTCTRDQLNCSICPVLNREPHEDGRVKMSVLPTSRGILEMINATNKQMRDAMLSSLQIPVCKVAKLYVEEHYHILDTRLSSQLEVTGDNSDHIVQPAFIVNEPTIDLNTPYRVSGRVYPHPKTQQAVLLIDKVEKSKDNLSTYVIEDVETLRIFQSDLTVEGIRAKLDDIYNDLESNVTGIFHRREIHTTLDLTYHSCLFFDFDNRKQNGWINALIIGDSSQGKSETALRLMEHYRLGARFDCKNASAAGLLGGVQQINDRWFVSWGIIPTHDRRLVILEELKGASADVISRLTDMRSSGIAEISKIEKRKAHARTRLVMISNPRSNKQVTAFSYGIMSITELIGNLEDIRRFDLAVIISANQIDPKEINQLSSHRPRFEHTYTSELCQKCILWAWTRKSEDIELSEETSQRCLEHAVELCRKFSESIPLVDQGTMRYKLARLAVAIAARTFSTEDCVVLRVLPCHVDFVYWFICQQYAKKEFGYGDLTNSLAFQDGLIDKDMIRKHMRATKYPTDLVQHLLHTDDVTLNDICDWCEVDRDSGQKVLSLLVRKHALKRNKLWYEKTSEFISLLKVMQLNGLPKNAETEGDEF